MTEIPKKKLAQNGVVWIPLWKKDLLTSDNFNIANVYQRGIYLQLFLHCRDNDYPGQFCFPENGNPMTIDQIIDTLNIKVGDRRDRIKDAIEVLIKYGMLFWNKYGRLELRKYAIKSAQCSPDVGTRLATCSHQAGAGGCPEVVMPLPNNSGLQGKEPPIREEKEQDKEKDSVPDLFLEIFNHWNGHDNLINHKAFTDKMKRVINGRLKEGYTIETIKTAITNYSEILKGASRKPPLYWWTYDNWGLVQFLQRNDNRFDCLERAKKNFSVSNKINQPQQVKAGAFSRGAGYFTK